MTRAPRRGLMLSLALLLCVAPAAWSASPLGHLGRGQKAYLRKDYPEAEHHFRAVVKRTPDSLTGRLFLGHSLFYQQKYKEAIPEYQKAREIGLRTGDLDKAGMRLLNDNLGACYGLTGQWNKAETVFEEGIEKDPDYPLYHYKLACVFAEKGDIDQALVFLRSAYQRRANLPEGQSLPDPRADAPFKRYTENTTFTQALKELGL